MWIPIKLTIENFISHKYSEFNFKSGEVMVILGENKSDEGQESNGSGKSSLIEGIAFSLLGESFKEVVTNDLINDESDSCTTNFILQNTITNKILDIKRVLQRGKSQVVTIKDVVKSSVPEYNKYILEELDIPKNDLINYFIITKDTYSSFLLSTDTKQKEIISRFSNSNLVDGTDKIIEKDIKEFDDKINKCQIQKSKLNGQIEVYQDEINNEKGEEESINIKNEKISKINSEIENLDHSLIHINEKIDDCQKLLEESKLKTFSTDELQGKVKIIEEKELEFFKVIEELKSKKSSFDNFISKINKNLAGSIVCPKCEHEFVATEPNYDVANAKNLLVDYKNDLQNIDVEIKTKKEKTLLIDQKKTQVKEEIKKIKNLEYDLSLEIKRLNSEISNQDRSKKFTEKQKLELLQNLENIEKLKFESNTDKLKEKIENIKNDLIKIDSTILNFESEKMKLVEWVYKFKKFKTHLTNKSIKSVESYTNLYLQKIRTNLNVKIEGFKLLADKKTIRESINVEIIRNGISKGSIKKFSGGEKLRIDICSILALQKLINLNSKSGGLDLLILDEIIECVDGLGAYELLKQFNTINQTIFVISHVDLSRYTGNVITIVKENGFSYIK